MKRKRALIAGLILVLMGGWFLRPYPQIDGSKVHPSLKGLDESATCDWTSFADGGSLSILVTKPDGSETVLCVSNSLEHSFFERGEIYVGADHFSIPVAVKLTGYDHTRFVLAKLLAREHPALRGDIALITKWVPDWISHIIGEGPSQAWDTFLGR